MTYNERYQVKRLSPDARRRDAEIAVRTQSRQRPQARPQRTHQQEIEDDVNIDGDDWEEYTGPLAAITKRYDRPPDDREYYHQTPMRRTQAPAAALPKPRKQLQVHWFVYVGVCLLLIVVCHYLFNDLGVWWQAHQDDSNYGMPRTYQVDAVVGHNDSSSNPSHFIAENLRGHYFVEELPGGDISKAVFYHFPTDVNNGNLPIVISFQDFDNDGVLDMVVKIGDPGSQVTYLMQNNGKQFVNKG